MDVTGKTKYAMLVLFAGSSLILSSCTASDASSGEAAPQGDEEYRFEPSDHPASEATDDDEMRVTLLGTGSPVPSNTRYGMSTLVQAGGLDLVFDAGRGSTVRLDQAGVPLGDIDGVFLTHYHSDHVNGLADLWTTGYIPAFGGRESAFNVYGPTGVEALVDGLREAHGDDIDVRVADGELDEATTEIKAHEYSDEGVVFDRDGVKVTTFNVQHDPNDAIEPAVGYRVDYQGRSVLISGDTVPNENVIDHGTGVDLLIHEVAEFEDTSALPAVYAHHTNPRQAGEIFTETEPRMAAYSHIVNGTSADAPGVSNEELAERTRETYDGPLTVGQDLMSFSLTEDAVDVFEP